LAERSPVFEIAGQTATTASQFRIVAEGATSLRLPLRSTAD
jgi:hypothetical protein